MLTATDRLAQLRRLYRKRGDARTRADIGFLFYAGLLVALIVGFPIVRAIVVVLSETAILETLQSPRAGWAVSLVTGVLLVLFAALGQVRGPVTPSPFFVTLLARTDIPRSVALRRSLVTTALVLTIGIAAVAGLLGGVLVVAGGASLWNSLAFFLASICFAVICAVLWLTSQAKCQRAWVLPSVGLAVVATTVLVDHLLLFVPWGWLGALWPGSETEPAWYALIALTALAIGGCLMVPKLLNALRSDDLANQADRWQSAGTSALTGDLSTALGRFRAQPKTGRGWRAVRTHNFAARFFLRDFIGTIRTPMRLAIGTVALIFAGGLSVLALTTAAFPAWPPAAAGAALGYLALGVFSDGFRHAAETAATPPLYGYSTERLYLLHSILPSVAALVASTLGATIALVILGGPMWALLVFVATTVVLVLIRAYDSAKGILPIALLTTPIPSPVGDPTVLLILAWQADALLMASITGAVIVAQVATGNLGAVITLLACAIAALLWLTKRRLTALSR